MAKKKRKSQSEVAWIVTRLTGTPAKYIGRVYAATEAQAIQRAFAEFRMPPEQRTKLVARREP